MVPISAPTPIATNTTLEFQTEQEPMGSPATLLTSTAVVFVLLVSMASAQHQLSHPLPDESPWKTGWELQPQSPENPVSAAWLDPAPVGQVGHVDGPSIPDLGEHVVEQGVVEAPHALRGAPPGRGPGAVPPHGPGGGGQEAAFLGEVFEGPTGQHPGLEVALGEGGARHRHEVGVGADGVEGIELDAAPCREEGVGGEYMGRVW